MNTRWIEDELARNRKILFMRSLAMLCVMGILIMHYIELRRLEHRMENAEIQLSVLMDHWLKETGKEVEITEEDEKVEVFVGPAIGDSI